MSSAEPHAARGRARLRDRDWVSGILEWCGANPLWVGTGVVSLVSIGFAVAWIGMDNVAPSYDQSHYLDLTTRYLRTLRAEGVAAAVRSVYELDPSHAPLFPVAMMPFLGIFGYSVKSGLLLNLLVWPVLLASVAAIGLRLFDWRTALFAVVLVATMPIFVGLGHEALVDFLLIGLTALTVALLLWSDSMLHRRISLGIGVAFGLGWLTKVDFPAFVAAPTLIVGFETLVCMAIELRDPTLRRRGLRRLANAGLATAVVAAIAAVWYIPSYGPTREYISLTTTGILTLGAAPANPRTLHAVLLFTQGMIDQNLFWVIPLGGFIASLLVLPAWLLRLRRTTPTRSLADLRRGLFLVAWFAIPYLSVALGHNQDYRLMAPAFIAVAIAAAALMVSVPFAWLRRLLIGGATLLAVFEVVSIQTPPPHLPVLPARYITYSGLGYVVYPFDGGPLSYDRRTVGDNDMAPIMRALEGWAPNRQRAVCTLQEDPLLNINTITFLADADGESGLHGIDPKVDDASRAGEQVAAQLKVCDAVAYIPPVLIDTGPNAGRTSAVNSVALNRYVSEADLALFPRRLGSFALRPGTQVVIFARE